MSDPLSRAKELEADGDVDGAAKAYVAAGAAADAARVLAMQGRLEDAGLAILEALNVEAHEAHTLPESGRSLMRQAQAFFKAYRPALAEAIEESLANAEPAPPEPAASAAPAEPAPPAQSSPAATPARKVEPPPSLTKPLDKPGAASSGSFRSRVRGGTGDSFRPPARAPSKQSGGFRSPSASGGFRAPAGSSGSFRPPVRGPSGAKEERVGRPLVTKTGGSLRRPSRAPSGGGIREEVVGRAPSKPPAREPTVSRAPSKPPVAEEVVGRAPTRAPSSKPPRPLATTPAPSPSTISSGNFEAPRVTHVTPPKTPPVEAPEPQKPEAPSTPSFAPPEPSPSKRPPPGPKLSASGEEMTDYSSSRADGWKDADAATLERSIQELIAGGRKGAAARIARDSGQFERALEWFLELGIHYQAGACLRALGRNDEALAQLLGVEVGSTNYRKACFELIAVSDELGRLDFDADRFLTAFVDEGPRDRDECAAYLDLAKLYSAAGFLSSARRCVLKVIALDPTHEEAMKLAGEARERQNAKVARSRPRLSSAEGMPELMPLEEFVKLAKQHAPT